MKRKLVKIDGDDGRMYYFVAFKRHWYNLKWKCVSADGDVSTDFHDAKLSRDIPTANEIFGHYFLKLINNNLL